MKDSPEFISMSEGAEVEESEDYIALVTWEQYKAQQAQAAALSHSQAGQDFPPIFSKRPVQIPEADPEFEDLVRSSVPGEDPQLPTLPGFSVFSQVKREGSQE